MDRLAFLMVLLAFAGCAAHSVTYDPGVTAADFVRGVDHPFFPLPMGGFWIYEGATERIEVRVLNETKTIMGVEATVVRDTVSVDGEVREDTLDWYGQDRDGNVWYLGEKTQEYERGKVVGTEGSWEWGVDGALPGIVMKARPVADDEAYFQEFYRGEAMDEASVIQLNRTVPTPAGTFTDTVTTREWTRLEPGVEEWAHYARGVGLVAKEATKGSAAGEKESLTGYHVG